jgi:hypothetical protein
LVTLLLPRWVRLSGQLQFRIYSQIMNLTDNWKDSLDGISPSQGHYLHKTAGQNKTQKEARRPCLESDSNPRSQPFEPAKILRASDRAAAVVKWVSLWSLNCDLNTLAVRSSVVNITDTFLYGFKYMICYSNIFGRQHVELCHSCSLDTVQ